VNHLTQEVNFFTRIFFNRFVADLNGIFNTIAEAKMAC
jgi:hypothetical protein